MRSAIVLVAEAGQGTAPDLTRYFVVCAGSILGLLALAWLFRRFVAGHLKTRAARRSLQVLDVLPLSGKQKLVVVRCYDRSFLLGVGEKEVRSIAELEVPPSNRLPREPSEAFSSELERELTVQPAVLRPAPGAPIPSRDLDGGVLA
jgi:flagellar biosynthetic protein FliO